MNPRVGAVPQGGPPIAYRAIQSRCVVLPLYLWPRGMGNRTALWQCVWTVHCVHWYVSDATVPVLRLVTGLS
jgi:hypothetical protein